MPASSPHLEQVVAGGSVHLVRPREGKTEKGARLLYLDREARRIFGEALLVPYGDSGLIVRMIGYDRPSGTSSRNGFFLSTAGEVKELDPDQEKTLERSMAEVLSTKGR